MTKRSIKIIHIATKAIRAKNVYDKNDPKFFTASWANTIAEKLNDYKKNHNLLSDIVVNFECWRFEPDITQIEEQTINDIKIKLYPIKKHYLYGIDPTEIRNDLKIIQENNDVVLHFHRFYNFFIFSLIHTFKSCPIIITNHGAFPPYLNSFTTIKSYLSKLVYYLSLRAIVHNIDYFNVGGHAERLFLSKLTNPAKVSPYYALGISFDVFKPINKSEVRKSLNIDLDSFVLQYTGSLGDLKGFDIILDTFKQLKKKFKTDLVCIGASKTDPYFDEAKKEGAIVFEKNFDSLDVPYIINAADVFLTMTYKNKDFMNLGMGMAYIEAMASNIPIVAFTLKNYPVETDIKHIGIIPQNIDDIIPSILKIKNKELVFPDVRNTAIKYLAWDSILKNQLQIYYELINKYYMK